jgi:hypothetical protein
MRRRLALSGQLAAIVLCLAAIGPPAAARADTRISEDGPVGSHKGLEPVKCYYRSGRIKRMVARAPFVAPRTGLASQIVGYRVHVERRRFVSWTRVKLTSLREEVVTAADPSATSGRLGATGISGFGPGFWRVKVEIFWARPGADTARLWNARAVRRLDRYQGAGFLGRGNCPSR